MTDAIATLETYKPLIARVAARWINPDRAIMLARMAFSKTPLLRKCDPLSIVAAVAWGVQQGLEPTGPGGFYLAPFWNSKRGRHEAQPIDDYRGLALMAWRTARVLVDTQIVYANDAFDRVEGDSPKLSHVPALGDRGEPVGTYAVASFPDGRRKHVWMTRAEVEAHRDRFSRAASAGPWVTDALAMWQKTVARRVLNLCPLSPMLHQALAHEEQAERGDVPDLTPILDVTPPDELDALLGTEAAESQPPSSVKEA